MTEEPNEQVTPAERCPELYTWTTKRGEIEGCQCVHDPGHDPPHVCIHGNDWGHDACFSCGQKLDAETTLTQERERSARLEAEYLAVCDHAARLGRWIFDLRAAAREVVGAWHNPSPKTPRIADAVDALEAALNPAPVQEEP